MDDEAIESEALEAIEELLEIALPQQAEEMLDFLMKGVTVAMTKDLPAEAIITTIHDYSCVWLSNRAMQDENPGDNETNKRLN